MVKPHVSCEENEEMTLGNELLQGNGTYALARALNQVTNIL